MQQHQFKPNEMQHFHPSETGFNFLFFFFMGGECIGWLCKALSNGTVILHDLYSCHVLPFLMLDSVESLLLCIQITGLGCCTLVLKTGTRDRCRHPQLGPLTNAWVSETSLGEVCLSVWDKPGWSLPSLLPELVFPYPGSGDPQVHSQLCSARHEGLQDVVAIPDPGNGEPLQPPIVLLPKQSQALGWHSRGAGQADGQEGMSRRVCAKAAGCLQMLPAWTTPGITAPTGWSQRESPPCHTRRPKCCCFPWRRTLAQRPVVRLRLRDSAPDIKLF